MLRNDTFGFSVLFVCWGHSCRSVMAEALAKQQFGNLARFDSAGLHPQTPEDARAAMRTLHSEFGIVVPEHKPCNVNTLNLEGYTCIVAMDNEVADALRELTQHTLIVWEVEDPWDGDSAAYRRSALEIIKRLRSLPIAGRNTIHG